MQLISENQAASAPFLAETVTLDVTGMKCAGCVRAVEQQLMKQPGVLSASVNLVTEVAVVACALGAVQPETLAATLTEVGFPTQPRYSQAVGTTKTSNGTAKIDLAGRRRLESRQQLSRLAIASLLLLLSALGHLQQFGNMTLPGLGNIWFHCGLATLALLGPGRAMLVDGWRGLRRNAPNMNTLVSLGTVTAYTTSLVALLFPQLGWECFFDEPVMLVGFILLGRTLEQQARNRAAAAFHALLELQPKVARLIKGGTEFKGGIDPIKGQKSELANPSLQPDQNIPLPSGAAFFTADFIEIPVDHVRVGEWLQVLPGDKIPVDGQIMTGQTMVNESMLTGESIPLPKQAGDFVAAGTLNQSGAIALRATRTGKDTTLAQIIALVEAAQTRKAPIQNLADLVAGYFTYGVMAIAALTFLFWYFIGTHLWPETLLESHTVVATGHTLMHHLFSASPHLSPPTAAASLLLSLKLAIAVLVVACPCTLGLATPTAILVGSGIGAERGFLIRGGDVLERVHQIDTVILDKTGTLTTGNPEVTDCIPCEDFKPGCPTPYSPLHPQTLLQLAASVEVGTRHPLAIAIRQAATQQNVATLPASNFVTQPGCGIAAHVKTEPDSESFVPVILGSQNWLEHNGIWIDEPPKAIAHSLNQAGKTAIYIAVSGQLAGLIAVADALRADAVETVACLKQMGLKVMMLTGDRQTTAQAIAQALGLSTTEILAEVLPEAKAQAISALQAKGDRIAMVGDGINDAPALAQADVGIALQSGTDVAVETAGIILVRDRLKDVVESIRLSRITFNKIRQNLFWAFAYNILGIPLAAGALLPTINILLNPAAAGAMMAFSSVSVVTNSLLLYLTYPKVEPTQK